jgi:signal-transduction protein with cAMP-binding, CBS, and nucleotidyltransferase domain
MEVRELTRKPPVSAPVQATVADVARLMDDKVVGAVVVVDGERPVGIVTDRDLVVRAVARGLPPDARIDDIMTTDLVVLDATAPPAEAVRLFEHHSVRRIPLVEGDQLVGVLSVDDLLVNAVSELSAVIRPITGQVIFGHAEPHASLAET